MIVVDCNQQDDVWNNCRTGIPTSSGYKKIITTKGEPSKQRIKYARQLAKERIKGKKSQGYDGWQTRMGVELEPEAIAYYELIQGIEIEKVGFVYQNKKKLWGASPDGLIGADGGLEVKCAIGDVQVDRLLDGWNGMEHFQQIQGNLLATGREWWDLLSYSPGLPHIIIRFWRDLEFLIKLCDALEEFCGEVDKIEKELRRK